METQNTPMNFYDAIVIGARCAGAPTAMLLARQGYKVLLLEKAIFPNDVPRGHVIQAAGVALLKEWGLFDRVLASNCPAVYKLNFDLGPIALTGMPQGETLIAPRHGILDQFLAEAAVESGVELREGFLVEKILMDGDRVTGIRGHGPDGVEVTEQAKIVIGADGLYSLVAETVHAPQYAIKSPLTCAYFTYFSDLPVETVSIYVRGTRFIVVFPTNDHKTCVGVQFPREDLSTFRADIAGNFLKTIELIPELADRLSEAVQVERFLGATDLPNFFRKPYGPGWALVGDAGYHKDPYTAQGISDAFLSAKLAAEAIGTGLRGDLSLEEALADYERQRNEDAFPKYEFNWQLATFDPPPPEMQQLFVALMDNQLETDRFFGTISGTVPIPAFFAPENMQRIIAQSGVTRPSAE